MKLKKLIEDSFDINMFNQSIKSIKSNSAAIELALQNLENEKNDLIKDMADREKRDQIKAKQDQIRAKQDAVNIKTQQTQKKVSSGIGTERITSKPIDTSATV